MLLIAAALFCVASLSFGQVNLYLDNVIDETTLWPLYASCDQGADFMADGAEIQIWVHPSTGADYIAPVGTADGLWTANTFYMNGYGDFGIPGTFLSPTMQTVNINPPAAAMTIFLKVFTPNAASPTCHWISGTKVLEGTAEPRFYHFDTWTCFPDVVVHPCVADPAITLTPNLSGNGPFPQAVSACAHLKLPVITQIIVPVSNATNLPVIHVVPGCANTPDCDNLTGWVYNPASWVYDGVNHRYVNTIAPTNEATGCCVTIVLDQVLPVEFTNVGAQPSDNSVVLNWTVGSETNLANYEVIRNGVKIASVSTNPEKSYSYTDVRALNGTTYSYKVVGVDVNGNRTESSVVEATPMANLAVITKYDVSQNYPNPFNPSTMISFDVLKDNFVTLKVYNAMGQEVSTLANGNYNGGHRYTVNFDAKNLTSGLYFYTIKIGNEFSATKKMLLVK